MSSGPLTTEARVADQDLATAPTSPAPGWLFRVRPLLPAIITLVAISVLHGIGPFITTVTTWVPLLAVPAAAGLPFLIPALRLWPLGESTWGFWAIDTIAVLAMVAVVALRIANSRRRHPMQGRARRFFAAWAAVILGVVVGNLVRGVFNSFVVHADIATFGGYLVANILVSAMFAAIIGLIPAAVAAIVGRSPARYSVG